MEGAIPKAGVNHAPLRAPVNLVSCRTSGQKGGVAPSTNTPSRAAHGRAGRGGDARGEASLRFVEEEAGNPC